MSDPVNRQYTMYPVNPGVGRLLLVLVGRCVKRFVKLCKRHSEALYRFPTAAGFAWQGFGCGAITLADGARHASTERVAGTTAVHLPSQQPRHPALRAASTLTTSLAKPFAHLRAQPVSSAVSISMPLTLVYAYAYTYWDQFRVIVRDKKHQ